MNETFFRLFCLFFTFIKSFSVLETLNYIKNPLLLSDSFNKNDFHAMQSLDGKELQYHGTTTISFIFKDSVIVAVDSRATIGNYVGSRLVKKVFPISKCVVGTMAGGAADCAHWIKKVSRQIKILEHRFGSILPVAAVAKLLSSTLRMYKGSELSVGTMVAGVDVSGPSLYYVDSEGTCVSGSRFCVGSGSSLAYAVLDTNSLASSTLAEAISTAAWAVRRATYRDGFSGGYINIIHINSTGCFHVLRIDSKNMGQMMSTIN